MQLPPLSERDHRMSLVIPPLNESQQAKIDGIVRDYAKLYNAGRSSSDRSLATKSEFAMAYYHLNTMALNITNADLPPNEQLSINEGIAASLDRSQVENYLRQRAAEIGHPLLENDESRVATTLRDATTAVRWFIASMTGSATRYGSFKEGEARVRVVKKMRESEG